MMLLIPFNCGNCLVSNWNFQGVHIIPWGWPSNAPHPSFLAKTILHLGGGEETSNTVDFFGGVSRLAETQFKAPFFIEILPHHLLVISNSQIAKEIIHPIIHLMAQTRVNQLKNIPWSLAPGGFLWNPSPFLYGISSPADLGYYSQGPTKP